MKYVMTRSIDELGRIVLPYELRNELSWKEKRRIDVFLNEAGEVILKPSTDKCVLCGNIENIKPFNKVHVCKTCVEELNG